MLIEDSNRVGGQVVGFERSALAVGVLDIATYLARTRAPWVQLVCEVDDVLPWAVVVAPEWVGLLLQAGHAVRKQRAKDGQRIDWPRTLSRCADDEDFRRKLLAALRLGCDGQDLYDWVASRAPDLVGVERAARRRP